METKEKVLAVLSESQEPMKAGEIIEKSGLEKKMLIKPWKFLKMKVKLSPQKDVFGKQQNKKIK